MTMWLIVMAQTWTIVCATQGQLLRSPDNAVELQCGSIPVLISVPHGGAATPTTMPLRTSAWCEAPETFSTADDSNTRQLGQNLSLRLQEDQAGAVPWVVWNLVKRRYLDANRSRDCASGGDVDAARAWDYFHQAITFARGRLPNAAHFVDLHGHGHDQQIEIGYLLDREDYYAPDVDLKDQSSIRAWADTWLGQGKSWLTLWRDLGTRFRAEGYQAIPSQSQWEPEDGEDFFSGGYNTARYTCADGTDAICGWQLETPSGVRNTTANRTAFAQAWVRVMKAYLAHVGVVW